MRSWFRKRTDSLIGLDIGSTSVKLVELRRDAGRLQVEAFGTEPLPAGAVVEGHVNDVEAVGEAIGRLRRTTRARSRAAAAAVSGAATFEKVVEMDASLSDVELEERIVVEAERLIPFPLPEVAVDFEVLRLSQANPENAEVLLTACRHEEVATRQAALTLGGCDARIIEVEAHALERAFTNLRTAPEAPAGAAVAVADIGAWALRLSLFAGDRAVHAREQRFGTALLLENMRKRCGLTPERASRALQSGELPANCANEVLAPFRAALADRIERGARQLAAANGHAGVERILLAGGGAGIAGLAEAVAHALDAPANLANPFAGMADNPKLDTAALAAMAPAMTIACGLALREVRP